jgi:hypothetical protein
VKLSFTLSDNALTTAWVTMMILLLIGIIGELHKPFPLQLGSTAVGLIIFFAGFVGLFEAFYEKGGLGKRVFNHRMSNIITAVGSLLSLLLGIGLLFNVSWILAVLSVWITLAVQFVILLAEGIVKRW